MNNNNNYLMNYNNLQYMNENQSRNEIIDKDFDNNYEEVENKKLRKIKEEYEKKLRDLDEDAKNQKKIHNQNIDKLKKENEDKLKRIKKIMIDKNYFLYIYYYY